MVDYRKHIRFVILNLALGAVVTTASARAYTSDNSLPPDNSFRMRTNEPIMVGNKLLPAGTYIWKRLDSLANRNIVQISNEATHTVQATVIAIPNSRDQPSDANEVDYWETPRGYPRAVRAWFLPGDSFGQAFAYPTNMAMVVPLPSPGLLPRPSAEQSTPQAQPKAVVNATARKEHLAQSVVPTGSWAVITEGTPEASAPLKSMPNKRATTLWSGLRKLPLTATIAPLIGLIGIVSLVCLCLSYLKRKRQEETSLS